MTHRHKWSPGNEDNPRPHCVLCGDDGEIGEGPWDAPGLNVVIDYSRDDGEVDGGEVVERRARWPFMRPTLTLSFAGEEER